MQGHTALEPGRTGRGRWCCWDAAVGLEVEEDMVDGGGGSVLGEGEQSPWGVRLGVVNGE